jgi:outer membrane protein assembly factor BamD
MMRSVTIFALLCLAFLPACSSTGGKDEKKNWVAEDYYKEAKEELDGGNYDRSVKLFEALGARFPFGKVAQQSLHQTIPDARKPRLRLLPQGPGQFPRR